jgi:hypothetical protein
MAKRPPQASEERPEPENSVDVPDRYDRYRSADIALVEIAKLQVDGEHLKTGVSEARKDIRESQGEARGS